MSSSFASCVRIRLRTIEYSSVLGLENKDAILRKSPNAHKIGELLPSLQGHASGSLEANHPQGDSDLTAPRLDLGCTLSCKIKFQAFLVARKSRAKHCRVRMASSHSKSRRRMHCWALPM